MGSSEVMVASRDSRQRGPEVGFGDIAADLREARFPLPTDRKARRNFVRGQEGTCLYE
jgi:hypothetical protein